jgi:hypothetical protein
MCLFVGIDPGVSGGIAGIDEKRAVVYLEDMPQTEADIADLIFKISAEVGVIGIIEKVHAFPGQGVTSVWTFANNYAGVRMAMVCNAMPFDQVDPRVWQKELGIPKREKTETKPDFKNRLRAHAQQLFPDEKVTLKNADALLIAEFLRRREVHAH